MTTHRLLADFDVCVPESQAAEYLAVTPRVVTHPDSIVGLTPKLNWMLDHLMDDEGIVFLDDDLTYLRRNFTGPEERKTRDTREPAEIHAIVRATFDLAAEFGVFFFGWETSVEAIRYYGGHEPFSLTGYVNGCAMGFRRGHGLRFDERIVAKNDYDISALNAFRHRRVLKDNRYAFCQTDTFTGAGGQSHYRNSETEARDCAFLVEKYGEAFTFGARGGTRSRDYAGVMKCALRLPF
ncbi:MAG TPA: hypothetical protein VHD61_15640 [Lacunisphaera sp.]|nr:hypothetical protein [Lacunisphaera sp.]